MEGARVWKLVGAVSILVGIIIALTPFNLAQVCTGMAELKNGMPAYMKCHWTGVVEVILGILVVFNGLLIVFTKSGWRNLTLMLGVLGIAIIVIPTHLGIGVCMNPKMPCHVTKTTLNTLGVALILMPLIGQLASKSLVGRLQVSKPSKA